MLHDGLCNTGGFFTYPAFNFGGLPLFFFGSTFGTSLTDARNKTRSLALTFMHAMQSFISSYNQPSRLPGLRVVQQPIRFLR